MSKSLTNKLLCLLAVACALCLAIGCLLACNVRPTSVMAEENEDKVLYAQDFSDSAGDLAEYVSVSDGEAVITSNALFSLPLTSMAESNNYSVQFDLKLTGTTEFYVHFVGLDGTKNDNIYLCVIAQGTYLRVTDNYNHDVYNNTGDLHGGLDATPVDLSEYATFRFVHYEGYVELWVNGTRRCVSHLCDFGNNNYMTRSPIEEGTVTAIAMQAQTANAATIDNIVVTEPAGASTQYAEQNAEQSVTSSKTFPLSAENLYQENFMAEGTFRITDTTRSDYFPTIKLYGLNASLRSQNQKEYAVNIQTAVTETSFLPQICWQPEDDGKDWEILEGSAVTLNDGDDLTLRVEVYGDHLDLYVNGTLSVSTTFTEAGLERGRVQYIRIQSGGGGAYWTDFEYRGFAEQSAAWVTASDDLVLAGSSVTFEADLFGQKDGEFAWYVNDEKQGESGRSLTLSDLTAGTYSVQYKSDTVRSEAVVVSVVDKLVTVTADKTELYPTDDITLTASLEGDFDGETFYWYVNGEPQDESGAELLLSGLAPGKYTVQYKSDLSSSNKFVFTVLESALEVTTEKNCYLADETATFTAEATGIPDSETIGWYVDGVRQEGAEGATFRLDMSAYGQGDRVLVHAETASGVKSEEISVYVAFDVMGTIKGSADYKVIYEDVIEEGGTYGNFSVGKDEDGELYLFSEVSNNSTYYTLNAKMPSNVNYLFEYELFIPADIATTNYVYPCLTGLNSKYPAGMVEVALNVNEEGISPYIKDQSTNTQYEEANYGFGKDLSYEGGISKKGEWNRISVAVSGKYIAMYINGEIALFFEMATATVPSGCSFNFYPDGGTGIVPLYIRNISFSGIVEPAPDLVSVTVSLSSVSMEAGGTITATATLNPFNAEAKSIAWFVNDQQVEGSALVYNFTSDTPGEYKIRCVIDGVASADKTVTVTAAGGGDGGGNAGLWIGVGVGCAAVIAAAVTAVVLIRKKKSGKDS